LHSFALLRSPTGKIAIQNPSSKASARNAISYDIWDHRLLKAARFGKSRWSRASVANRYDKASKPSYFPEFFEARKF